MFLRRAQQHLFGLILIVLSSASLIGQERQEFTSKLAPALASDIDPALLKSIDAISAIDNHQHSVLSPPAMADDRNFDALPVDNMEPQTDPVGLRADAPMLRVAYRALWGVDPVLPLSAADAKRLATAREVVRRRQGDRYSEWVLDKAQISTALANRVSLGHGVQPPRFRWVPYVDALLFPLDNSGLAEANADRKMFFKLEDTLRLTYLAQRHRNSVPATLREYVEEVVKPILRQQRSDGAVAVKFELAYLRPFGFATPSEQEVALTYERFVRGGQPDSVGYTRLQDYLFHVIAAEAGRLGMAVHLHTMAGGGSYFDIAGGNPMLLEPIFDDPSLRKTRFVMLHGGWPYIREAGSLLQKPNVYLDLSQQALFFPARTLSGWLREWLEIYPEKVLFGTDAYPYSTEYGWEEGAWIASRNARLALALALTGMLRDGEISRNEAVRLAHRVLHDNAATLYSIE